MRVLLVEDDEPVTESLRRGLKRYGFEVDWVTTGAAALAHSGPCDVALMTREQIMEAVWDANWYGPTKTLDVHVAALRRKLAGVVSIEAVRGVGLSDAEKSPAPRDRVTSRRTRRR